MNTNGLRPVAKVFVAVRGLSLGMYCADVGGVGSRMFIESQFGFERVKSK